jgi:hypothetical protein
VRPDPREDHFNNARGLLLHHSHHHELAEHQNRDVENEGSGVGGNLFGTGLGVRVMQRSRVGWRWVE